MNLTEGHFEPSLVMQVRPRCPACEAPNPDGLPTCSACGAKSAEAQTVEVPAIAAPSLIGRLFGKT